MSDKVVKKRVKETKTPKGLKRKEQCSILHVSSDEKRLNEFLNFKEGRTFEPEPGFDQDPLDSQAKVRAM